MALFKAYQGKWTSEATDFPPKWPHDLVNFRNNSTHILLCVSMLLEPCTLGETVFVGGGPYLSNKNGRGGGAIL